MSRPLFRSGAVAALLCATLAACATGPRPAAATLTPAQVQTLLAQAQPAIAGGDLPAAIALYEQALAAAPELARVRFRLGTLYLRNAQPELAQRNLEQALRTEPGLDKAYANLALAHLAMFRLAAARAIASEQVSEANRAALRVLLRDVDHAMFAPAEAADAAPAGAAPLAPVTPAAPTPTAPAAR